MFDIFFPPVAYAAEGDTVPSITDSLNTAFTSVAGQCMDAIASILPVVLPVMGAVVVIGLAVGIFKRFVH